jgi:hypothetical protein
MADESKKPARPARKKRGRKPREEFVDYIVEIEDWDWGYIYPLGGTSVPLSP